MLQALGVPGLTYRERVVLAAVAYHDGPGGAYPSLQLLADECAMQRWAVAETISALVAKGKLAKERGRTTNRYRVLIPDCRDFPDTESDCQDLPDTDEISLSGKTGIDCQENPDTNQKNRHADSETRESACRNGSECGWRLKPDADRCSVCGQDDVWPF